MAAFPFFLHFLDVAIRSISGRAFFMLLPVSSPTPPLEGAELRLTAGVPSDSIRRIFSNLSIFPILAGGSNNNDDKGSKIVL
jgi:hypothetical protein